MSEEYYDDDEHTTYTEEEELDNDYDNTDDDDEITSDVNIDSKNIHITRGGGDDINDDDEEETYKKFNEQTRNEVLVDVHKELIQESYSEIQSKYNVIRNENGMIIDPYHKTLPILTKYERTKIIGIRSKQLSHGAQPMVSVEPDIIDPMIIAEKELEEKALPFIIVRPLPNGEKEYWKIEDLEYVNY